MLLNDEPAKTQTLEVIVERFEHAWQSGQPPAIEDFLGETSVDRQELLVELVLADLEHRVQAGEKVGVEDYLRRFPELMGKIADGTLSPQPRKSLDHLDQTSGGESPRPHQSDSATPPVPPSTNPTVNQDEKDAQRAAAMSREQSTTVPGYEILGLLGRGGMGEVYKALDRKLNRMVALKMILGGAHADAGQLARFRAEAKAVAQMKHPNIVQIYEIGEMDGLPYFALEFCVGGSLDRKLRTTSMPPREAAELVRVLAEAMQHAHDQRVVHRDLKPANVLLAADGTPKITDFGLAKTLDAAGLAYSGAVMGTPSYMAPEQTVGNTPDITFAVDIYGLGAILYELLTGRPPFKGISTVDTLRQVVNNEPVPPSQLQPKTPRDLEAICLMAIQKDRRKRYSSAHALADDLQRFLNNEPIHARPTPPWEKLLKWARRRPAAAALVGVTFLAGFALVAAIALYAVNESQYARLLQQELKMAQEREQVRERSSQTLLLAQRHEAAEKWNAAHNELEKAQAALESQPDLRADELRAEIGRRLDVVRQKIQEQEQRQQADIRLMKFQKPYDDALFYETSVDEQLVSERRNKARAAARAALAIYDLDGETGLEEAMPILLERDKAFHSAADQVRLASACFELLLIWSESEAAPAPEQVDASAQRQAAKALAVLERAARLGQVYGLETRTYHLRKARYLAQSKGQKVDRAEIAKAVTTKPAIALDWFLEGLDCYRAGDFEQASQSCGLAVRQQGNHFWARYVVALCHLRLNRWVEGKAELSVCANQRPDFVWPRLLRGYAAFEVGYKAQRESQAALAELEFAAAEEDLNFALRRDSSQLVQYVGLANRGALHIRRQHWTKAIADLREAVKIYPQALQGHINLSKALQGEGSSDAALAALDQGIKLAPHEPLLFETRARLHLLRKHWQAARADFEQAIALEPKGSRSESIVNNLMELGILLNRERQYQAALPNFDRAVKLQPDFVLPQRYRAETLLALDRHSEAAQALDRYMAGTKSVPGEVYQVRGLIYAEAGQLPAAIEMYTLALRQNDKDIQTRCHRGWTLLLTDATRLALEDFEACLGEDETNLDAMIGRGNARIRLRQLDEAVGDAGAVLAQVAAKKVKLTYLQLYKLARIYAQAAGQVEAEARTAKPGPKRLVVQRMDMYQGSAEGFLRKALVELPEDRRSAFWRDQIQSDPAFTAIKGGNLYSQLAERYSGKGP